MGYVVRLKRNQLVGGNNNDEIYPITATNAVYRGGKNLENILDELGKEVDGKKVIDVTKDNNTITVKYSNGESKTFNDDKGDNITVYKESRTPSELGLSYDSEHKSQVIYKNDEPIAIIPCINVIPFFGNGDTSGNPQNYDIRQRVTQEYVTNVSNRNNFVSFDSDGISRINFNIPKVVAAVSLKNNKLVITYLEDTANKSQSETELQLPDSGSSVTVTANNPTLERNIDKTVGSVTVNGTPTALKVNAGNIVTSTNVADVVFIDKNTFNSLKNSGALVSSRLYLVEAETTA